MWWCTSAGWNLWQTVILKPWSISTCKWFWKKKRGVNKIILKNKILYKHQLSYLSMFVCLFFFPLPSSTVTCATSQIANVTSCVLHFLHVCKTGTHIYIVTNRYKLLKLLPIMPKLVVHIFSIIIVIKAYVPINPTSNAQHAFSFKLQRRNVVYFNNSKQNIYVQM